MGSLFLLLKVSLHRKGLSVCFFQDRGYLVDKISHAMKKKKAYVEKVTRSSEIDCIKPFFF